MRNEWISSVTTPIFWYSTCLIPIIFLLVYFVFLWFLEENPREAWLEDKNVVNWEFILENQREQQEKRQSPVHKFAVLDLSRDTAARIRDEIERNDHYTFLTVVLDMDDEEFDSFTLQVIGGDENGELIQFRRNLRNLRLLSLEMPRLLLIEQVLQNLPLDENFSKAELDFFVNQFPDLWDKYQTVFAANIPLLSTNFFVEVVPTHETEIAVRTLLANNEIVGYFVIPEDFGEDNVEVSFVALTDSSRADLLDLVNWYRSVATTAIQKYRFERADIDPSLQRLLLYETPIVSGDVVVETARTVEIPKEFHRFIFVGFPVILLFVLVVSTGRVISNVFDEKSSKLADNLLASISPLHLLDGKLWGAALISLTVMSVWAVVIPAILFLTGNKELRFLTPIVGIILQPGIVANFVLFLMLLYAFYGYFLVAFTSLFSTLNNSISAFVLFVLPVSFIAVFSMVVPFIPVTFVQDVISFVPLSAPFVMVARSGSLPAWPVYVAIVVVMILSVISVRHLSKFMFVRGISDETRISL